MLFRIRNHRRWAMNTCLCRNPIDLVPPSGPVVLDNEFVRVLVHVQIRGVHGDLVTEKFGHLFEREVLGLGEEDVRQDGANPRNDDKDQVELPSDMVEGLFESRSVLYQ